MHLLRLLYFFLAIYLTAKHIPGIRNTLAGSLSCNFMRYMLPRLFYIHEIWGASGT